MSDEWGATTRKVERQLLKQPNKPTREIAADVGCSVSLVRATRSRLGMSKPRRGPFPKTIKISADNMEWLITEAARSGVDHHTMANAVINDARLEE